MSTHFSDPSFDAFAIASTIVAIHLLLLAMWTGAVRLRHKRWINAEDGKLAAGAIAGAEHPDVQRVQRAHGNLIQNAVPFFMVGGLFAATSPSRSAALAYYGTFVGARVLHTVFYLFGLQPFRTIAFAVGLAATIGMAFHVLRAAL